MLLLGETFPRSSFGDRAEGVKFQLCHVMRSAKLSYLIGVRWQAKYSKPKLLISIIYRDFMFCQFLAVFTAGTTFWRTADICLSLQYHSKCLTFFFLISFLPHEEQSPLNCLWGGFVRSWRISLSIIVLKWMTRTQSRVFNLKEIQLSSLFPSKNQSCFLAAGIVEYQNEVLARSRCRLHETTSELQTVA